MYGIAEYSLTDQIHYIINLTKCINFFNNRCPDSFSKYLNNDEKIGLFHTRLSIIDTSDKANQPIGVDKYNVVMIFNREIYNFKKTKKGFRNFHNQN